MNEIPPNAIRYAARRQLELAEPLGSGKDVLVLVAKRKLKPARVAIKILRFEEAYWREKLVYQRLEAMAVNNVLGFYVPELIDSDDELMVLEMTIVKRPFVLDFAAAYLDRKPEFSEDVWATWEEEKKEQFEERWPMVQEISAEFAVLGIYLLDVSPGNIGFLNEAGGQSS